MRIAVAEGDGIGKEVVPPCTEILNFLLKNVEFINIDIGYSKWMREGLPITEDDIDLIGQADCMLFGAVTSVPGHSVVAKLRKTFDLFVNLRPVRSYFLTQFRLNLTIIRENLEGLYSGIEEISEDMAVTKRIITRSNAERLATFACGLADSKTVTIVHKANVLKSDIFFRDVCAHILQEHGISYNEMYIDAAAYQLIKHPEKFDFILTSNLYGDILSDEAAALAGSLGLCPSANIGPNFAIFEPVHGSAPQIAGKGIANPVGAILSCKMLLEWIGEYKKAVSLDAAVKKAIQEGYTTPDLGGGNSTKEVVRQIIHGLEG